LQYKRLYDQQGQFRAEVGARAVYPAPKSTPAPANSTIRVRRLTGEEEE
jgi:hypothetical protein